MDVLPEPIHRHRRAAAGRRRTALGFPVLVAGDRQATRPNWWLDLHNWLGGLALVFTGLHLVTVWLNSDSGIGLVQIFLPQTAAFNAWAITWGVLATYVMAAAVFTTWPRRWKNRRWWRVVHVSTVAGTGLVFLHAYQSGSDASKRWFQACWSLAAGVATYGLGLRLSTLRRAD